MIERARLTWHCFNLVQEVLAEQPEQVRDQLVDVALTIKVEPDAQDFARGATEGMRGYFWGTQPSVDQGGDGSGVCCPEGDALPRQLGEEGPNEIVLFAGNIRPLTRENVAVVLMHEVGHLCGFDEFELEALGLCG